MLTARFRLLSEDAKAPRKGSEYAAGFDLPLITKYTEKRVELDNGDIIEFYGTGVAVEWTPVSTSGTPHTIPYFQLHVRSSVAKTGYTLANSTGIIDYDYRGEILAAIRYHKEHDIKVPTDRPWVQLVPSNALNIHFVQVTNSTQTIRGTGGFGSTTPSLITPTPPNAPRTRTRRLPNPRFVLCGASYSGATFPRLGRSPTSQELAED